MTQRFQLQMTLLRDWHAEDPMPKPPARQVAQPACGSVCRGGGGGGAGAPATGWQAPPLALPLCLLQVQCGPAHLSFHGSLLQLRGAAPSSSPLRDATGNLLLFNGQVFGGGLAVPPGAHDAQLLLGALAAAGAAGVPAVLTGLRGPWAVAYWQQATRTLWFGRDPVGELGWAGWLILVLTLWQPGEHSTHLPRCWAACWPPSLHACALPGPGRPLPPSPHFCRPPQPAAAPAARGRRAAHAELLGAPQP